MDCRVWPAHPEYTLVAVPELREYNVESAKGDLALFVLNTGNLEIMGRRLLNNAVTDGYLEIVNSRFDTANYKIGFGLTAFGLRIGALRNFPSNTIREEQFRLFQFAGGEITPLVENIRPHEYTRDSGDERCSDKSHEVSVALAVARTVHHGLKDIVATAQTIDNNEDCSGKYTITHQRFVLTFDGQRYKVPKSIKSDGP